MPHSTTSSTGSAKTFDLTGNDRPATAQSDDTMKNRSRKSSSAYGVAVTSSPAVDERMNMAPQQQQQQLPEHGDLKNFRRRSTPGTADDYAIADMIAQRGNIDELVRANDGRSFSYNDASKRRTQYYEDQFQYKEGAVTQTRERVQRQTPVIAELKTNVIIKDEFTLVTDLSYQLAQRYTRPDSCIMIKIDHSACLAMGGTFDPCYILTINAVSSQMGPSTNKRNASLIQSFMADILSVPAERGIITFMPIPEENLATGGNTILGEMEKAEKQDRGGVKRAMDDGAKKSTSFNKKNVSKMEPEVNGHVNGHVNGVILGGAIEKKTSNDSSDSSQVERPKTAHGTSGAVNGLRMNPISADEQGGTNSAQMPNGRPKSVGANVGISVRNSIAEQIKQEPIPNVVRQTSQQAISQTRPPSALKTKTVPKTQSQPLLAPRPVQVQPNPFTTSSVTPFSPTTTMTKVSSTTQKEQKDKAVYLDMVTALPAKPAPSVSVEELSTTRSHSGDSVVAAANTAKRRSATMMANPKIPQIPPAPAVPEETRSIGSRLSKRKSFLRVFKRESKVEPWYKQ